MLPGAALARGLLTKAPGGFALLGRRTSDFVERLRRLAPAWRLALLGAVAAVLVLVAWLAGVPGSAPDPASGVETAPLGDVAAPAATSLRERELALDSDLAERAQSILARIAGQGRVVVRVRSELDPSEREETRERFDPEDQIERSEERTIGSAGQGEGRAREGTRERVEYEVGKQVTRAVTPPGALRRLHVAVLVDGRPGASGEPPDEFAPWSASELAQLEALAKQAVGFSGERGDTFTLTSAPLESGRPQGLRLGRVVVSPDVLRFAAFVALAGVLVLLGLRSLGEPPILVDLPMSADELEAELRRRAGLPAELAPQAGVARSPLAGRAARDTGSGEAGDAGAAALRAWLRQE